MKKLKTLGLFAMSICTIIFSCLIAFKGTVNFVSSTAGVSSYEYNLIETEDFQDATAATTPNYNNSISHGRFSGTGQIVTSNSIVINGNTLGMRIPSGGTTRVMNVDVLGIDKIEFDYRRAANTSITINADSTFYDGSSSVVSLKSAIIECYGVDTIQITYARISGSSNQDAGFDNFKFFACQPGGGNPDILPQSVEITGKSSLKVGETTTLNAIVSPSNAVQAVTWESSNNVIATINSSGLVSALQEGIVTITATSTKLSSIYAMFELEVIAGELLTEAVDLINCPTGTLANNSIIYYTIDNMFKIVHERGNSQSLVAPYSPWRVYGGNTITITNNQDITSITRVVITATSSSYASVGFTSKAGTTLDDAVNVSGTSLGSLITFDLSTYSDIKYFFVQPAAQTRWSKVEVYYTPVSGGGNTDVPVTSVSIDTTSTSLSLGSTLQLDWTVLPSNATDKTVSFATSSSSIISVNSTGLVTANNIGQATITVTTNEGNKTDSLILNVVPISVTGVAFSTSSLVLPAWEIGFLEYEVLPSNATNQAVAFASSDENVIIVEDNGEYLTGDAGNAVITITTLDGNFEDTLAITVTDDTPPVVTTYNIACTSTYTDGQAITNPLTYYTSSNLTLTSGSATNLYGRGSGVYAFRLGSSSNPGSVTFNFNQIQNVSQIKIIGWQHSITEAADIRVSSDINTTGQTINWNFANLNQQTVVYSQIKGNISSLTISNGARSQRINIAEIIITSGDEGGIIIDPPQEDGFYQTDATTLSNNLVNTNLYNYSAYTLGIDPYLPSRGQRKMLVVPVDFTNYKFSQVTGGESTALSNINKLFFGDSTDTGWESVSSFYYKSSYGKLSLTGEVTPVWHLNYSTSQISEAGYAPNSGNTTTSYLIRDVRGFLQQNGIDGSEYDTDNDGVIDAVWFVYAAPIQYGNNSELWAYVYAPYDLSSRPSQNTTNPYGWRYAWASYEFMFEGNYANNKVDAHTFIHETGHLLGLDDYYNYEGDADYIGAADMMSYNVGDHNVFSKFLMGWINPYVIDGTAQTATVTLESAPSSGDCLLIKNTTGDTWNNSPFDNYLLLEFYTPTGLNALDSNGYAGRNGMKTYGTAGVKLYQVDNRIYSYDPYTQNTSYTDTIYTNGYYMTAMDNSTSNQVTAGDHPLIELIPANKTTIFRTGSYTLSDVGNSNYLFKAGSSFSTTSYASFFLNGKLYDGSTLGYSFTISSIAGNTNATISVSKV